MKMYCVFLEGIAATIPKGIFSSQEDAKYHAIKVKEDEPDNYYSVTIKSFELGKIDNGEDVETIFEGAC